MEIAHYLDPVRRYLAWRFPNVSEQDREDIAQNVLIDMHEKLIARYDPSLGRFRTFLKTAIDSRVLDLLRKQRRQCEGIRSYDLDEQPDAHAMHDGEAAAIDVEAETLSAIRAFHDRYIWGSDRDRMTVRCYAYRVVEDLSEREIGARLLLTRDQVKEALRVARTEILRQLAAQVLSRDQKPALESDVARAAELVRMAIHEPGHLREMLDREPSSRVRDSAEDMLTAIQFARQHFAGLETDSGREFLRELEEILMEA